MADPDLASPVTPETKRNLGHLRMVWDHASRYPRQLAIALGALVTTSVATLAVPWLFRKVIDSGYGHGSATAVTSLFQYMLMVVVVLAFATAVRFYSVSWLGERVVADIRAAVQRHLLTLAPRF